jgi:hypothetical protein
MLRHTSTGPARVDYPTTQTQRPTAYVDVIDPQPSRHQSSRLHNTWGQKNPRRALPTPTQNQQGS